MSTFKHPLSKVLPGITLLVLLATSVVAQDDPATVIEKANLRAQALFQNGKVIEATAIAEQALRDSRALPATKEENTVVLCESLLNLANLYQAQGRFEEAEHLFSEFLAIVKRVAPEQDQQDPIVAQVAIKEANARAQVLLQNLKIAEAILLAEETLRKSRALPVPQEENSVLCESLLTLANLYQAQARFEEAEHLYAECLAILKKKLPEQDPMVSVVSIAEANAQAPVLFQNGKVVEAISLAEKTLQKSRLLPEQENMVVGQSLMTLAVLYLAQTRYEEAEPLLLEALAMSKKQLPEEHPLVSMLVIHEANARAQVLFQNGKVVESISLAKETLDNSRLRLGQENVVVAECLVTLASLYQAQSRYEEARRFYNEALMMVKKLLPEGSLVVAQVAVKEANARALALFQSGKVVEAIPIAEEALRNSRRLPGEDNLILAESLNNLAVLYEAEGRYSEAEPLSFQALGISKKLLPEDSPVVARYISNLAYVYYSQSRYTEAEPLYLQALGVWKNLKVEEHPDLAVTLSNLGVLYAALGRYQEAEILISQALAMSKKLLGEEHPSVAVILSNLGVVYYSQGRDEKAEALYVQALAMWKKLLGEEHPNVALGLNNLALVYYAQRRYGEAEPLLLQALAVWKKLGQEDPNVALGLNNLAFVYVAQRRYGEAEPLLLQALATWKKQGEEDPNVAAGLNNLATLYHEQGRYEEAEPLLRQALQIWSRKLGKHPNVAMGLTNLAVLVWARQSSLNGSLQEVSQLLGDSAAMRSAVMGRELKRRGEPTANVGDNLMLIANFERNSADIALSFALRPGGLANSVTAETALLEVWEQKGRAQEEARRQGQQGQPPPRPLSVAEVHRHLPEGSALLEFAVYYDLKPQMDDEEVRNSKRRYAACILRWDRRDPLWLDLGGADTIESETKDFLKQVRDPSFNSVLSPHFRKLWPTLTPLLEHLNGVGRLFVAEDEALNMVPLQAVKTQQAGSEGWIGRFEISYLNSGRDLSWRAGEQAATGPSVVAGLNRYGIPARTGTMGLATEEGACPEQVRNFPTLRQAEPMAWLAAREFGVTPMVGPAATGENLKHAANAVPAPKAVVVVVHGCVRQRSTGQEKELLLVMSNGKGGWNYLSARDLAEWPLQGSALYVMACWAGSPVGKVVGDLRQAATLAGVRYLIAPLWEVPEQAAYDFLVLLLEQQRNGLIPATALRAAQRSMRKKVQYEHPYYWAGYTVSGTGAVGIQ